MYLLKYSKCVSLRIKSLGTTVVQRRMYTDNIQEPGELFESVATAGVITLNRPKHLNVLDYNTWTRVLEHLRLWESTKSRVIIKGAGDRAFSAGGNIKFLLNKGRVQEKRTFIRAQHNSTYLMSKLKIPYISLMDGITFGGGLAIANGRYRVATERTVVATPETRIGWLTDAGAPYYLSRLGDRLGFYMALTGARVKGEDAVTCGLATHFVPSTKLRDLETELYHCKDSDIEERLNAYSEPVGDFSLAAIIKDVDYCFSGDTVEEIIERLSVINNSWSTETIETLGKMCPTMLKVSLRAVQRAKACDFKQSLRMENRVLYRCVGSYNAFEGVRALLLDKDQPKWKPATLAEVSDAMVESYFDPIPEQEELRFFDE